MDSKKFCNVKKSRGFTLIELIVVMVIIGILAAFAVPRFVNLSSDARVATVKGIGGSIRAAASLAHGVSRAQSKAQADSVSMSGQTITMSNHYPTADAAGIDATLADTTGFTITTSGTQRVFTPTNATAATCSAGYVSPTTDGNAPTITVVATDCSG